MPVRVLQHALGYSHSQLHALIEESDSKASQPTLWGEIG